MKKLLLVLGIAACLQLTACGADSTTEETEGPKVLAEGDVEAFAGQYINYMIDLENPAYDGQLPEDSWDYQARNAWIAAVKDMGSFQQILGISAEIGATEALITIEIEGSERNATVQFVYTATTLLDPSVTVIYSDAEMMTRAALNTLLGMGTTFAILILISVIIAALSLLPKLQGKKAGKVSEEEARSQSMDQAIAQIIEKEEQADERELIAVITAAIAASQDSLPPEGFRVRSIRKINTTKWKQA